MIESSMAGYNPNKMVRLRPRGVRVCDGMMRYADEVWWIGWVERVREDTTAFSHAEKIGHLTFVIILDKVHISFD